MFAFRRRSKRYSRMTTGDRVFDWTNNLIMVLVILACAYPFYYCIVLSFNDGYDVLNGGIFLWPRALTLENYRVIFRDNTIPWAFVVTCARTLLGTALSIIYTSMVGFALGRPQLKLRKLYVSLGLVTMYVSGGIIPLYMLIKELGMVDSFWVYILPNLSSFYNIVIVMAFFRGIPASMVESAKIDGANEFQVYARIVMPVSGAVLATIGMFNAVFHWNSWFDGYIYISSQSLKTLPLILVEMINQSMAMEKLRASGNSLLMSELAGPTENSVRLATMVVAVLPILGAYPFCQKYFVKGIMLGSVKG